MPAQESMWDFYFFANGFKYGYGLPLSGMISLGLTIFVLLRCRGPMATVLVPVCVAFPVLAGIYGVFEGLVASWMVIAKSSTPPSPAELGYGKALSLVSGLTGVVCALPSFFTALIISSIRSLTPEPTAPQPVRAAPTPPQPQRPVPTAPQSPRVAPPAQPPRVAPPQPPRVGPPPQQPPPRR